MTRELKNAEVFDFTIYKMNKLLMETKRNPKAPQAQVLTLVAIIEMYLEGIINILWDHGEPYMSLHPDSDMDEEDLKKVFMDKAPGV